MPRRSHAKTGPVPAEARAAPASSRLRSRPSCTFVVRLWREARDEPGREPVWRGTVSDLHGRPLGSFQSASELVRILGRASGATLLLHLA